ncbi:MAG: hydratase [Pseudomonadota bacterium]
MAWRRRLAALALFAGSALGLAQGAWAGPDRAPGQVADPRIYLPPALQRGTPGCANPVEIAAFAENWLARRPSRALGAGSSLDAAHCTQRRLVNRLRLTLGEPIGHLVGLTNAKTQALFETDRPVRGVALEGMLLDNGATLPERFGYWPFIEADLLVIVGSDQINDARSPRDVLDHVAAVRPFIGLVDIGVRQSEPVNVVTLTAQNTGARFGVLGAAIPAEQTTPRMLAALEVTLADAEGARISGGSGRDFIGGNPLNSVLWLLQEGVRLRRGDMVNLGSFGLLTPAADAKGEAVATFQGLPGAPQVRVRLR